MWEAIGSGFLRGANNAGWIMGLLCVLGMFLGVLVLFCLMLSVVFGDDGEEEDEDEREEE